MKVVKYLIAWIGIGEPDFSSFLHSLSLTKYKKMNHHHHRSSVDWIKSNRLISWKLTLKPIYICIYIQTVQCSHSHMHKSERGKGKNARTSEFYLTNIFTDRVVRFINEFLLKKIKFPNVLKAESSVQRRFPLGAEEAIAFRRPPSPRLYCRSL